MTVYATQTVYPDILPDRIKSTPTVETTLVSSLVAQAATITTTTYDHASVSSNSHHEQSTGVSAETHSVQSLIVDRTIHESNSFSTDAIVLVAT